LICNSLSHDLCVLVEGLSLEDGDNGAVTNRRY
jgi:hypothetical protein